MFPEAWGKGRRNRQNLCRNPAPRYLTLVQEKRSKPLAPTAPVSAENSSYSFLSRNHFLTHNRVHLKPRFHAAEWCRRRPAAKPKDRANHSTDYSLHLFVYHHIVPFMLRRSCEGEKAQTPNRGVQVGSRSSSAVESNPSPENDATCFSHPFFP